jgi:galactokinase
MLVASSNPKNPSLAQGQSPFQMSPLFLPSQYRLRGPKERNCLDIYTKLYMSGPSNVVEVFVPGRVCLLGEHSDWAGMHRTDEHDHIEPGHCLVYGTDCGIHAKAWINSDTENYFFMKACSPELSPEIPPQEIRIPFELDALLPTAQEGGFFSYAAGVAYVILSRYGDRVKPISIDNYLTDMPIKKGLSSSAAVCVIVARSFNMLFHLGLSVEDEMEMAFLGEIATPSRCGRMDQCCAFGKACVSMRFDGPSIETAKVEIPADAKFYFVVADLRSFKDTKKILDALGACFPHHEGDEVKKGVQTFLGSISASFVQLALAALRAGDPRALGRVFTEYQSLFDLHMAPACRDQLESPALHRLLEYERVRELCCGGKGVGSQGDGSVQFVCETAEDQERLCQLLRSEECGSCHAFKFTLSGSDEQRSL